MFTKTIAAATAGAVLLTASQHWPTPACTVPATHVRRVYRQSLAIPVPKGRPSLEGAKSRHRWLEEQQCDDGGYMAAYRSTHPPCSRARRDHLQWQDTNSTSLAAAALYAVGERRNPGQEEATSWLLKAERGQRMGVLPGVRCRVGL